MDGRPKMRARGKEEDKERWRKAKRDGRKETEMKGGNKDR